MALVKNINGSSDNKPSRGYSSWQEYWEDKKNRIFSSCSCITCLNKAKVGGHVKIVNSTNEWYIVPLCYEHNNMSSDNIYRVLDDDLLRVN